LQRCASASAGAVVVLLVALLVARGVAVFFLAMLRLLRVRFVWMTVVVLALVHLLSSHLDLFWMSGGCLVDDWWMTGCRPDDGCSVPGDTRCGRQPAIIASIVEQASGSEPYRGRPLGQSLG
jgi:hypothetical protein